MKRGETVSLTDGNGAVKYNYKSFLDSEGNSTVDLKNILLSIDTAQAKLLKQTKWMK